MKGINNILTEIIEIRKKVNKLNNKLENKIIIKTR
jgi:hypothetical protein